MLMRGLKLDARGLALVLLYGTQHIPLLLSRILTTRPEEAGPVVFHTMLRAATDTCNNTVFYQHGSQGENLWTGCCLSLAIPAILN
jgi:hypothetical protein